MLQAKHLFDACYIAWFTDSVKPAFFPQVPNAKPIAVGLVRELASHVKRHTQMIPDRLAAYNKSGVAKRQFLLVSHKGENS
jgi:hypothetical protein